MSFYCESLAKSLQEKIACFKEANLHKEASLLQTRLNSLKKESIETSATAQEKAQNECALTKSACKNLRTKLSAETRRIPELEKQFILKNIESAKNLKDVEPFRIAYIERLLKASRASHSEKIPSIGTEFGAGPYNNEKTFNEALQLIYSQDPLWIEDLKELYFSIMPLSSS